MNDRSFDFCLDFRMPWGSLSESREQYSLRWESKYLLQMGTAMDYIFSCAMTVATQEALKHTFLQGIHDQMYISIEIDSGL